MTQFDRVVNTSIVPQAICTNVHTLIACDELTGRTQWVTWKFEGEPNPRTGKRKKILKNPKTGKNAQANNPRTWGTFDDAVNALATYRHEGLGFVFTNSDPYVGIDLDNCINPDGTYTQLARSVLAGCNSYAEVSPSGTGIHLIVRGAIPHALKPKSGEVEIYTTDRYFTMTGNVIDDRTTICDGQTVLDRLFDQFAPAFTPPKPPKAQTIGAIVGDHPEAWVKKVVANKLDSATRMVATALDGTKHHARVNAGNLLGGLLAWLDGIGYGHLLNDEEAAHALHRANEPQANKRSEYRAIVDGIGHGRSEPLIIPPPQKQQPKNPIPIHSITRLVVNQRYLSLAELTSRVTLVRSPLGTGKTETISRAIPSDASLLVVTHRRSLGRNLAQRFNTAYYEDCSNITKQPRLTICLDSILKLNTNQRFDYVVIDECEQVLTHLAGKTIEPIKREHTLARLELLITSCNHAVMMDAYLDSISLNFIERIIGTDSSIMIENTYKPASGTVYQYPKRDDLLVKLRQTVDAGKRAYIAVNSKKQVRTIEHSLRNAYPDLKIIAVHGDNSDDADVQSFITNINDEIVNYDVVIASPAIVSGVSIDVLHFHAVFVVGESRITTHTDLLQQSARVRRTIDNEIHCWIAPQIYDNPTDADTLRQWAIANYEQTGVLVNHRTTTPSAYDERYLNLVADIKANHNRSINNLSENAYAGFAALGYAVVGVDSASADDRKAIRTTMTESKNQVIEADHAAIVAMPMPDPVRYSKLKQKQSLTSDERFAVAHYELRTFYELPTPEHLTIELYKRDQQGYQQQVRAMAHVLDIDVAKHEDVRQMERKYMRGDMNHYTLKATLRRAILAVLLDQPTPEICFLLNKKSGVGTLNMVALTAWLHDETNKQQLKRVLGKSVDADNPQAVASLVTNFLADLGLKRTKIKQTTSGNREYTLDLQSLTDVVLYAEQYIERKRGDMEYDAFLNEPATTQNPIISQQSTDQPRLILTSAIMDAYDAGKLRTYCADHRLDFDSTFDQVLAQALGCAYIVHTVRIY